MAKVVKFGPNNSIAMIEIAHGERVAINLAPPIDQGVGIFGYLWTYEDKQYGICWFDVATSGEGSCTIKFSNGKKWDGDNFAAIVELIDNNGVLAHYFAWSAGMNSAGISGGAKEREFKFTIDRDVEWWSKIREMKVTYSRYDKYPDQELWDKGLEVLQKILSSGQGEAKMMGSIETEKIVAPSPPKNKPIQPFPTYKKGQLEP